MTDNSLATASANLPAPAHDVAARRGIHVAARGRGVDQARVEARGPDRELRHLLGRLSEVVYAVLGVPNDGSCGRAPARQETSSAVAPRRWSLYGSNIRPAPELRIAFA